jgi:outer membrane protein TolC
MHIVKASIYSYYSILTISFLILRSEAGESFTLDSLIRIAIQNNPEIKMAHSEALAAQARILPARQLPDPRFRVGITNVPTTFSITSDEMTMFPDLSIMQTFPWFGKLKAAGKIEESNYNASLARLAVVFLQISTDLKKNYAQMYNTEKSIQYLSEKQRLLQSMSEVAQRLYAMGQVPQQDVFRTIADISMAQSEIINAQSSLADLETRLGALLGQNAPQSVQISILLLPPLFGLDSLEVLVNAHNPELKRIRNLKSVAQTRQAYAKKNAIPDLDIGASYGFRWARMPDGTRAPDMISIEMDVTLPIFYPWKQRKMIQEANFMAQSATEQYHVSALTFNSQLRSLYAAATAQAKQLPLYSKKLVPQYEATYNASLASYSVGATTFAMLIDNLTILINAKMELAKIESEYFSAIADIAALIGENSEINRSEK